jgi:hypothetical protein
MDFLLGGNKLTHEQLFSEKLEWAQSNIPAWEKLPADIKFNQTHEFHETNGLAASLGGGFDVAVNRVLAFRVCNLQYIRTSNTVFALGDFSHQFRFSTGFILRVGNW